MVKKFDFLVIGSGIAGMSFALKVAHKGKVALICKSGLEEANTYFAQGGVARPFSKKFNPSQILNSSIFLLGLVFLVLLVPSRSIGLYIILPFIAILQGLIQPNSTTIVSSLASKDSQGEILGINQSVISLAQAIPPIVSGYIVSININLPMIVASLSTLLAGLVFVSFFSRKKKEKFHEVELFSYDTNFLATAYKSASIHFFKKNLVVLVLLF